MRTREDQISELRAQIFTADCFTSLSGAKEKAEAHILEAERRAEERVRAEIGRDSERLDWLQQHAAHVEDVSIHCTMTLEGDTSFSLGGGYAYNLREAIDAARNGGE